MLRREGYKINQKRVYRLYKEQNLQMRTQKPKRRVQAKSREDKVIPLRKNEVWSMDFVSDALFTGEKIRILTIVDAHTRASPGIGVGFSYKAHNVVQTLEQAVRQHGLPKVIRVDNGPEFVSKDLDLWAYANKVTLDFSRPGKPTDNAYIESFNSRFCQECLNEHWFLSLEDAKLKIMGWWREYNSHRPHSSLGYMTPEEFANLRAISAC
jgi:putative transposase